MVHSGTSGISLVLKILVFLLHLINLHLTKIQTQNLPSVQREVKVIKEISPQNLKTQFWLLCLKDPKVIKSHRGKELTMTLKLSREL